MKDDQAKMLKSILGIKTQIDTITERLGPLHAAGRDLLKNEGSLPLLFQRELMLALGIAGITMMDLNEDLMKIIGCLKNEGVDNSVNL